MRLQQQLKRVWMGGGGGGANISSQLKFCLFVSCQLNFGPFVICQLSGC